MEPSTIDRIDRRLLALLQRDNRRPLRALADELGVSAPTCLRRVRRLQARGIIRHHVALLDPELVGFHVTAYIEVSLGQASGTEMAAFELRMQRCAEVVQCAELAGEVDYLVKVVARDLPSFSEFTRKQFADDKAVRSYRTLLVLRQSKGEHALPIG